MICARPIFVRLIWTKLTRYIANCGGALQHGMRRTFYCIHQYTNLMDNGQTLPPETGLEFRSIRTWNWIACREFIPTSIGSRVKNSNRKIETRLFYRCCALVYGKCTQCFMWMGSPHTVSWVCFTRIASWAFKLNDDQETHRMSGYYYREYNVFL